MDLTGKAGQVENRKVCKTNQTVSTEFLISSIVTKFSAHGHIQAVTHVYEPVNAAAAAKSLQSCLTLCDPIDGSPPSLPRPWDPPGKNTGVGCHFLLQCMKRNVKLKSFSHVQLLATPWTAAYQAPLFMGFSRQEYWSGVPSPSPEPVNRAK